MKKIKFLPVFFILTLMGFSRSKAQQFFNGTVNTTSTINRTGSVGIGNVILRGSSGIQVLEHTTPTGDFYIRSVAYQVPDDVGNLILNDIGGFVGIGTSKPKEALSVNGKIRAHEIKVETSNWPDYVFEDGYKLFSLKEISQFVKKNKHLPGVPRAIEIEENGLALGEMNKIMMQKLEELTLHLIEKEKKIESQEERLNNLEKQIKKLIETK